MSDWVGKLGQNVETNVTVKGCVWREAWGNEAPRLYLLEDAAGNVITIRATIKLHQGQTWGIDGKVKRQHTFNGQKQTHITGWSLSV